MKFAQISLFILSTIAISFAAYLFGNSQVKVSTSVNETTVTVNDEKRPGPLDKYKIESLINTAFPMRKIEIYKTITDEPNFRVHVFRHKFDPGINTNRLKTVTGQINIPKSEDKLPLVFMIRGFASQETYKTGVGTQNAAAYFAENGFITVAPDFLGYAESDSEANNIFETRFQTYTTVLSLLKSLASIDEWDGKNVFIWAHSNGGQVTLTTLAITGADYPATLWAPVTKPFPYSILYFSNEATDSGKFLRHELANFESLHEAEKYSFDGYIDRINAPILLHQGTADDAVPVSWSNDIYYAFKSKDKAINYYTYSGADHNLRPEWDRVVARDLEYFRKYLKKI